MGIDLTQDQITRLFADTKILQENLDEVHTCVDEIKPDVAVVKSQVGGLTNEVTSLKAELHDGLAARLRRVEYYFIATFLIVAAEKVPGIGSQVWNTIRLFL